MSSTRKALIYFTGFCGVVFGIVVVLFLVALGRALTLQEPQVDEKLFQDSDYFISDELLQEFVQIFSGALKYKTVSTEAGQYDREELLGLQTYLMESFPLVFNTSFIEVEIVNNYSFLLTVKGSSDVMQPYMLAAHLDVVPVDAKQWTHDPFLGDVVEDPVTGEKVLWGRGALDNKSGVLGILSALELLLSHGWKPSRTFFVGFGHDEEVGGGDGARHIAMLLTERKVTLEFLLDEGMPITQGAITGTDIPVAAISVSEKGHMDVRLSVESEGGHSSVPPKHQAVGILASALQRIYDNPQPSMFGLGPEADMLTYLAPKASWPYKLLFANTWLFGPLLSYSMSKSRFSDAFLRTTTAITIVRGGVKNNVVPASAWALINHRIHPAQSLESVLAHDIASIADDRVKVEMLNVAKPHPMSPYGADSLPYRLISETVKHVYPEAIAVPSVMVGNTDTKMYLNLTSSIYRMAPQIVTTEGAGSIHGKNERISVSNLKGTVLFFSRVIRSAESSASYKKFKSSREAGEL